MECMMSHPELQNLRKWILGTLDAHSLYEKFGFVEIALEDGVYERADIKMERIIR